MIHSIILAKKRDTNGIDFLNLRIPAEFLSPLTDLQWIANQYGILNQYMGEFFSAGDDVVKKMRVLTLGVLATQLHDLTNIVKSFPICTSLGETFVATSSNGAVIYLEKISRKPDIICLQIVYPLHKTVLSGRIQKESSLSFSNTKLSVDDKSTFELKGPNMDYWWDALNYEIDGLLLQTQTLTLHGEVELLDKINQIQGRI